MGRPTDYSQYIGQTFGRLTILSIFTKSRPSGRLDKYFHCQCSCGNLSDHLCGHVIKGESSSCGCLLEESRRENGRKAAVNFSAEASRKNFKEAVRSQRLHKESSYQKGIREYIESLGLKVESEVQCLGYLVDLRVGNVYIECNSLYWHATEARNQVLMSPKDELYHYNKFITFRNEGYRLVQLWDYQSIEYRNKILRYVLLHEGSIEDFVKVEGNQRVLPNDLGELFFNSFPGQGRWYSSSSYEEVSSDNDGRDVLIYDSGFSLIE